MTSLGSYWPSRPNLRTTVKMSKVQQTARSHEEQSQSLGGSSKRFSKEDRKNDSLGLEGLRLECSSTGTSSNTTNSMPETTSASSHTLNQSLYKEGRKVNGHYSIITIRLDDEQTESDGSGEPIKDVTRQELCLLLRCYSPITSRVRELLLTLQDLRRLLRAPGDAPLIEAVQSWSEMLSGEADVTEDGKGESRVEELLLLLWPRVVEEVVSQRLERGAVAVKRTKDTVPVAGKRGKDTGAVVGATASSEGQVQRDVEVTSTAPVMSSNQELEPPSANPTQEPPAEGGEAEARGDAASGEQQWAVAVDSYQAALRLAEQQQQQRRSASSAVAAATAAAPQELADRVLGAIVRRGLKLSSALLKVGRPGDCLEPCKAVVAAGRRLQGISRRQRQHNSNSSSSSSSDSSSSSSSDVRVGKAIIRAYRLMGDAYLRQRRPARATSALTLAVKVEQQQQQQQQLEGGEGAPEKANVTSSTEDDDYDDDGDDEGPSARELLLQAMQMQGPSPQQQQLLQQQQQRAQQGLAPPPSAAPASPGVGDMEDMLRSTQLLSFDQTLKFGCTMCGECCRTSDHILLTPADLWRMTRAPALERAFHDHSNSSSGNNNKSNNSSSGGGAGKKSEGGRLSGTTVLLRSHPLFQQALKYTLKDGLPVCFLRPVKSDLGHCHFAYPLYKRPARLSTPSSPSSPSSSSPSSPSPSSPGSGDGTGGGEGGEGEEGGGVLLQPWELAERGLEVYVPIKPSDYNLTEEEEEEALRRLNEDDGGEDWEKQQQQEEEESEEEGGGGVEEEEEDPEEVMNSFGKQALGCMLGVGRMPTMCASYPMARELVWADFWHTDPQEEAALGGGGAGSGVTVHARPPRHKPSANSLASSAPPSTSCCSSSSSSSSSCSTPPPSTSPPHPLEDEQFVVVKTQGCEAFYPDGQVRTQPSNPDPTNGDPLPAPSAPARSVREFVSGESDLTMRWEHQGWFMRLLAEAGRSTAMRRLHPEGVLRRRLIEQLARCWYNFDSLAAARTRPLRSWGRVRMCVEGATRALLRATDEFVEQRLVVEEGGGAGEGADGEGGGDKWKGGHSEEEVERGYLQLVTRLHL